MWGPLCSCEGQKAPADREDSLKTWHTHPCCWAVSQLTVSCHATDNDVLYCVYAVLCPPPHTSDRLKKMAIKQSSSGSTGTAAAAAGGKAAAAAGGRTAARAASLAAASQLADSDSDGGGGSSDFDLEVGLLGVFPPLYACNGRGSVGGHSISQHITLGSMSHCWSNPRTRHLYIVRTCCGWLHCQFVTVPERT